jgi:hypothetical protein
MSSRLHKIAMLVMLTLLVFEIVQRASAQPSPPVPAQTTSQPQAISQTGLLPLFAVDMDLDPLWIDGDAVPSTSPQFSHSGVNDLLDQAWTTMKPAGFNAIRFPVHLDDLKSPTRLANLCVWANTSGVRLIPVLQGTDAMRKSSSEMSAALGTFITTLITKLRGTGTSALPSYAQISFYQLERSMNQTGLYPGLKSASAQKLLLASSAALRQAETQALQGTGIQGTPISVGASYDFELIRQGAITGVALDPAAEQKAQDSLKEFLNGLSSPNIDAINIEWFPRSISSGDVDHFVTLLQFIKQAFPDKEVTLSTGFSSAFTPADQALQFYAAAVSNLGGFRAADGADSKFVGVVLHRAFQGMNADSPTPAGTSDPSQWKWGDRAQQLSAMWSKGTPSADMSWWTARVLDNMGFMALNPATANASSVTPLPTLQGLQEIASTLSQATQQVQTVATTDSTTSYATPAASPGAIPVAAFVTTPTPGYVPGAQTSVQAASSPFQQLMLTLLQQFAQEMTTKLMAKSAGSNLQNGYPNPANPGVALTATGADPAAIAAPSNFVPSGPSPVANTVWIGPTDVNVSTSSPQAGQPVVVTAQVHNQSPDQDISGLTVELVNPANPSASNPPIQSGVTVPRSGVTPVQLTWAPDPATTGNVQLLVEALDSGGQIVTTVAVPPVTVQGATIQGTSGSVGNVVTASTPDTTVSPAANTALSTNAASPTNSSSTTNTGSATDSSSTTNTVSPTNSDSTANAASPTNSGSNMSTNSSMNLSFTTSSGSTTGSNSTSSPMPHLVVARFGYVDRRSSAAGQIPPLQAQISNHSQTPTQSGQAQLFLDGKPQQMQTVGPILPSGTLLLQFPATQAGSGLHNLQLVVTTIDGANAAATLTANVTSATATTSAGSSSSPTSQPNSQGRPAGPRALRSMALTTFRIANTTQGNTSSPDAVAVPNPGITQAASSNSMSTQSSQSPAPSAASDPTAINSPSMTPVTTSASPGAQQSPPPSATSAGNSSAAIARRTFGRTITAGGAQSGVATVANSPMTPTARTVSTDLQPASPAPSTNSGAAMPAATPQRGFARTITPGSAQSNGTASTSPTTQAIASTQSQPPSSSASGSGALGSTPQRATIRTITPNSVPATTGAAGSKTTAPLQPPAVRTITAGAGIPSASPATVAQTPLTPATSESPVATRPTAGVRTLTPASVPSSAPSGSAAPTAGAVPKANTPTRTIAALSPGSSAIPNNSAGLPTGRNPAGAVPASTPGTLDLAVLNQDIHVIPSPPQAGQTATFTAIIRNNGTVVAQGATAVFSLVVNGQRVATSPPMVFNVAPHGTVPARWSTGVPAVASVQVMISVMANGDSNPANNQAAAPFAVASSAAKAPLKPR